MVSLAPNRPTLDSLRHLPVGDIIALPAEHLALLQAEAREAVEAAKRMQDWIEAAIALRYEQRAVGARAAAGKNTGTVRFDDGAVEVTAELPKRVDWDQRRLADLAAQIRAGGEDPGEYLEVSFKVPERAYVAWPERIRQAFEPARTVRTGRQTFRLTLKAGGA
ncbi:hypothetical protein GXW77_14015 [Roseomonas alkaliterrae]|uniref:Uncharacterized protein n=1 Tax=Neoroseomonas alkaliterrae TaxID=1452450 RepID=A0A840Y5Q5_9PROT|nr:hypothetical protein [Neoroseomonas alkaliterrae]MBB5691707.1 hypothetical protein [Neoroseomonas alkaliterrae]MBR0677292.1 hypothetical protein [Neoroseomonas alkaliterrae]